MELYTLTVTESDARIESGIKFFSGVIDDDLLPPIRCGEPDNLKNNRLYNGYYAPHERRFRKDLKDDGGDNTKDVIVHVRVRVLLSAKDNNLDCLVIPYQKSHRLLACSVSLSPWYSTLMLVRNGGILGIAIDDEPTYRIVVEDGVPLLQTPKTHHKPSWAARAFRWIMTVFGG